MRTVPSCRGRRRLSIVFLTASILLALASCGGDDPQDPGDSNGNEIVVLSADKPEDWSALIGHDYNFPTRCTTYDFDRITDVSAILSNGAFRVRTYSYGSGTCCVFENYLCEIQTTKLVDLTPYKTARVKGQVRMYMQREAFGGCGLEVRADFCGLTRLVDEKLCERANGSVVTKDFDLNISDALDCARGTFYLTIRVGGWCGGSSPTWQDNEVYVEVRNLRIVVTK